MPKINHDDPGSWPIGSDHRPEITVTISGPRSNDLQRVWRVAQLMLNPEEWDGPTPKVALIYDAKD